jgi:integrase
MNLDLFTQDGVSPAEYAAAMQGWLDESMRAGRMQRESSVDVYLHMWSAMSAWAVGNGIKFASLAADDIEQYLASRGGADDLSAPYAWRLLRLVERVWAHETRGAIAEHENPATELLARRPDLRYANDPDKRGLPEFLAASEAKRLVTYLSAVRPGRGAGGQHWQEIRNRASVALILGAGLAPGDVRMLELEHVVIDGGRGKGVPWKLRVPGNGNSPARETPVAPWAGQLLRYWLDVRAEQGIPGKMLFPSTKGTGKPWGKVAQYNAAREVLEAAGLDDVVGGSFRLRHTFALRQLRRGKSADDVAKWLGVSDPSVMVRYQRVLVAPIDVV